METLRHLQEFITYVDFKADNVKDHKDIYCELTNNLKASAGYPDYNSSLHWSEDSIPKFALERPRTSFGCDHLCHSEYIISNARPAPNSRPARSPHNRRILSESRPLSGKGRPCLELILQAKWRGNYHLNASSGSYHRDTNVKKYIPSWHLSETCIPILPTCESWYILQFVLSEINTPS